MIAMKVIHELFSHLCLPKPPIRDYRRLLRILMLGLLLSSFIVAFARTAWVCDDSFITFRVVDNCLSGHGLTWNPGERVQVFTHPLWLGVLVPLVGIFRDPYFVSLLVSFFMSVGAIIILLKAMGGLDALSILLGFLLIASRAFVDFSSSGLENPLNHFLVAVFLYVWIRNAPDFNRFSMLVFIASLMFLCRPDAVVIFAPCLFSEIWLHRRELRKGYRNLLLALSPALIWVSFSLFYFGSPVPNTAIAKVQTGIPLTERFMHAWAYIHWSIQNDGVTIGLMLGCILLGWINQDRRYRLLVSGVLFFIAYLGYVGADYMGGRFLSACPLISIAVLSAILRPLAAKGIMAIILAMAFQLNAFSWTLFSDTNFSNRQIDFAGIADERGFYYQGTGLIPCLRDGTWKTHPWLKLGQSLSKMQEGIYARGTIGMIGYAAGPKIKWIDPMALADPFLARLPSRDGARPGHFERAFPDGYLESRLSGINQMKSAGFAHMLNDIRLVTEASLFDRRRWGAIWRLNTHKSQYFAGVSFDRNAIGLPRVPIISRSPFSILGIPYGGPMTWRLKWSADGQVIAQSYEPF